jgi:membrane protein YqaA with SNARE-associated domain
MINSWGYIAEFAKVKDWFAEYGLLVLLPASILPFPPFKVFTIAAGAMRLSFVPFIIVVIVVRWLHFFLVPLMLYFGKRAYLARYEDSLTGD